MDNSRVSTDLIHHCRDEEETRGKRDGKGEWQRKLVKNQHVAACECVYPERKEGRALKTANMTRRMMWDLWGKLCLGEAKAKIQPAKDNIEQETWEVHIVPLQMGVFLRFSTTCDMSIWFSTKHSTCEWSDSEWPLMKCTSFTMPGAQRIRNLAYGSEDAQLNFMQGGNQYTVRLILLSLYCTKFHSV